MKERSIILNTDEVRAVLDGRKTQHRVPIKTPYGLPGAPISFDAYEFESSNGKMKFGFDGGEEYLQFISPFGAPGDLLWVRETWQIYEFDSDGECYGPYKNIPKEKPYYSSVDWRTGSEDQYGNVWRPSIHMPRWASRINLLVKRVWVDRVQDITAADAKAEGDKERSGFPEFYRRGPLCHVDWFRHKWNSKYEKKGFGWNANPWVWACEFEVQK